MSKQHQRGDRKAARANDLHVKLAGVTYVVSEAVGFRDWWLQRGIVRLTVERVPAPPADRYGPETVESWYECHVEVGGVWRASGEGATSGDAIRHARHYLRRNR